MVRLCKCTMKIRAGRQGWLGKNVHVILVREAEREAPMTESEWLAGTHPVPMLRFLQEWAREKTQLGGVVDTFFSTSLQRSVSNRKLRLFAVGCCRILWDLLPDELSRNAVAMAERFADGDATAEQLAAARDALKVVDRYWGGDPAMYAAAAGAGDAACFTLSRAGKVDLLANVVSFSKSELTAARGAATQRQAALLRCVFGNPFRPLPPKRGRKKWAAELRSWLAWHDGIVAQLAQSMYDERAFGHLPVLADALEEAGCHEADLLDHCRQPGEHVRGCWVVDLILGKT